MSAASARARWTGVLGAVLVVAGLVLGGWVAWQVWGTNVVAQRTHRDLVEGARREWDRAAEVDGTAPAQEVTFTEHGAMTAIVRIPRFGEDYAVPLLEGTDDEVLAAGFGRFTDAAAAGGLGNFAIAAHRVTHGEPLRDMPELEPGDEVLVETPRWTYRYVLDTGGDDLTVPFTAGWVLDDLPANPEGGVQPEQRPGQRLITVTTCSELFHTDDRLVAFGHLASREPTGR
ncbi:class E sortase [Nocardioides sp. zg-1308]|uniref:class E sortase n=1 Tax=Nocardioides TaxID=1839 RepID=UPI0015554FC0|nr:MULTISPECIES: class E sortase [unclassified Nocardioides]NPD04052.1 class E sortase [Nocardioides sp. zg-1308]WQQ21926.1 class E sortase [Nocardioides sp. S-34]